MRLMWKENVFGWVMTGLLGANNRWFFGFSRAPRASDFNVVRGTPVLETEAVM
jgi:hypothetical protein